MLDFCKIKGLFFLLEVNMIHIKIADSYVSSNPIISENPAAYILHIGDNNFPLPSTTRSLLSIEQAVRDGSPFQLNLRPYEDFSLENELFQVLVNSTRGGNDPTMMNRILFYVAQGIIEVRQDSGAPMTASGILNYTAP